MTRIESARAFSTGIGALPDGTVLQTHVVMPLAAIQQEPFAPSEIEPVLNVFDPEGGLLGQAPLPYSAGYAWHASSVTGNLLLAVSEPYPMVIEYRLRVGPEEG